MSKRGPWYPPEPHYTVVAPMVNASELLKPFELREEKICFGKVHATKAGIAGVVTPRSSLEVLRGVERLAYYFKREFQYDFPQFSSSEDADPDAYRAYVWTDKWTLDDRGRMALIGVLCFRWRVNERVNETDGGRYQAQWAWFHPYQRRKGLLTKAWPYFVKRFGRVIPEPPLSPAMESFLRKQKSWPFHGTAD